METVLDVLKAMEKASAREIAARMKIEPRDALEMLNEQQEIGTVTFLNGYWLLSGIAPARTKTVKCGTLKPEASKEMTVKIGEQQLTDAIRENGPLTAEDLATMFDVTSRKVVATLANATGKGRLSRVKQDGKFRYCIPETTSAPEAVPEYEYVPKESESSITRYVTSAIDASTESDTVQVDDKPPLVLTESHPGCTRLPTPKEISRVIRKLRSALHQAELVRKSVIAAKKHEKTLNRMTRLLQELQQ
ncbi:DUF1627 domain-containing protein [Salmonella enterica]|nr:DUF1627 domain-containing protein [Salmonella enterica]ELE1933720.1 DUF1627 domain-containing protein [Salmonella enterica]